MTFNRGRALEGLLGVYHLAIVVNTLASIPGWPDAPQGRPCRPVPLSPLRREEVLEGEHFDHLRGQLGKMGEPGEAWPFEGDDCELASNCHSFVSRSSRRDHSGLHQPVFFC